MTTLYQFTISAFGDEIAEPLEDQLKTLNDLNITHLEMRSAWGTNVLKLTDDQAKKVRATCDDYGITISCLGSPVGKSPITDATELEIANIHRLAEIAKIFGTNNIRIFSFYPPDNATQAQFDQYVGPSIERLQALANVAERHGLMLLLENEKGVVGDTPERCLKLMEGIDSKAVRFIWDPANFVQCGAENQVDTWWDRLGSYIGYIHIKDAHLADGTVCPAGEGDGQVDKLLQKLAETGYQGVLALEPHLAIAGHSSGFSGVEGMTVAVGALRKLIAQIDA